MEVGVAGMGQGARTAVERDEIRIPEASESGQIGVAAHRMRRGVLRRVVGICLVALCLTLAVDASATAYTAVPDGISDQSLPNWDNGFTSSYFAGFFKSNWVSGSHIQYARYVVQWNAISLGGESRSNFENWLTDIASMGLTSDVALTSYNGEYPSSSAVYKTHLKELLSRAKAMGYPIRYLEAWNEPNNQGGYSKVSEAVAPAHFTNSAYAACEEGYGCTIIAGNVEDNTSAKAYEEEYRNNLNPVPTIWGLHPYYSVEYRNESYYAQAVEGLPNKGAGDQVWITEVSARKCTDYGGHLEEHGEAGQAERAEWLVNNLIPTRKPEHVFYYEFMLGGRKQPSCGGSEDEDGALYVPSSDPNAPDAPRPAASFIWVDKGVPWGYTGGATNVQPKQATLTGSVYPGGHLDARYHFEYGTTTGYGSYSAEGDAGSGSGLSGASLTIGLEPGTTYHYRIVAWNGEGSTTGADNTVTTTGPVEAATGAATGVGETEATLNGTVNPRGYDSKYYFQYGETTSYGSSTPEGDAGSGSSPVAERAIVSGLLPGTTYHYRLVATSGGVTSYGGDQTYATVPDLNVFWEGTNGQLNDEGWNPGSQAWSYSPIGSANVMASSASTVVLPGGYIDVFWEGANGQLNNEGWNPGSQTWSYSPIGSAHVMASSASAVALPGGYIDVFWEGTNGQLNNEGWNPGSQAWSYSPIGSANVMASSASTVVLPGGYIDVFWEGTNGQLNNEGWNPGSQTWSYSPIGSAHVMASSASAVALPGGYIDVFWEGTNGQLNNEGWNPGSQAWSYSPIGSANVMASSASTVVLPGGYIDVFWEGANGQLNNEGWNPGSQTWSYSPIGSAHVMASSASAVALPGGYIDVFWEGTNGQLNNEGWNPGSQAWSYSPIGSANVMASSPFAVE